MKIRLCEHWRNCNLALLKPEGIVLWLEMLTKADEENYVFVHQGMMAKVAGISEAEFSDALAILTTESYWGNGNPIVRVEGVGFRILPFYCRCFKHQRRAIPEDIRKEVLSIGICAHCGSDANICVDHIVPVAKFGGNERENLQPLCRSCNSSKRDRFIG